MPSISLLMGARSRSSSTPEVRAASRALAEIGSQPPNTRSSSEARGTKSRIRGLRPSPRLPSRMWAICETEPIGGYSATASGEDAGDEGRRHRAETGEQYPELSGCGGDLMGLGHPAIVRQTIPHCQTRRL